MQQTVFVYDNGQVVLEFDQSGDGTLDVADLTHRYLWGPAVDQALADEQVDWSDTDADGPTLWALADHLGTVRDVADSSGLVVNHRIYDAFGALVSETNAAKDYLFGYTGKAFDEQTGLQNNLNRWYDPAIGRWLSEDPIRFAAGDANLSRYVGNASTIYIDPSGLSWGDAGQVIYGAVIGGLPGAGVGAGTGAVVGGTVGGISGTCVVPGVGTGVGAFGGAGVGALGGAISGAVSGAISGAVEGWNTPGSDLGDVVGPAATQGGIGGVGGGIGVGGPIGTVLGGAVAGGASAGVSSNGDPGAIATGAILGGGAGMAGNCLRGTEQEGLIGPLVTGNGVIWGGNVVDGAEAVKLLPQRERRRSK